MRTEPTLRIIRLVRWVAAALASTMMTLGGSGRSSAQDWAHYGGDAGGTRYSTLNQINRQNVASLQVAWTYHAGDISDGTTYTVRSTFECTPLVVDRVMYLTTPFARVIALDAESGKELWAFDPKLDKERPYNLFINRGVALWRDGKEMRIFVGTLDGRLFALNTSDGKPIKTFGEDGCLDFRKATAEEYPRRLYGLTSPPLVYKNLVIAGSIASDSEPQGPSGDVRAFDARTGRPVWRFHVVPHPGELGNESWEGDSWNGRGGVNAWSLLSCDDERGIVYLPLTSPAYDLYGGDRKGQNLFGDSLVALDAQTGKLRWYFQIVHHDLWDYDLPAQPVLTTVHRNGTSIPAVAQVTKMGFVFLFDRVTGKPLFPIEERKVAPSEVPGEQAWPTQPFPLKPLPVARQAMTRDEITDVTPESRAQCLSLLGDAKFVDVYTPWKLDFTVNFPGDNGGVNWGGASYDPVSNLLVVNSMDVGLLGKLEKAREGGKLPYRYHASKNYWFWDSKRYPCQMPPWGRLTAIDLDTGDTRWQVPLGVVDELVARGIPPTGTPNIGGSVLTAGGLVFIAATSDSRFRAFDKETGKELWAARLPASGYATPMTFMGRKTGKQFVVIAAGGGNKYDDNFSDALVAYTLP